LLLAVTAISSQLTTAVPVGRVSRISFARPVAHWLAAGYFMTKIFHPNVSDKGDICVNTLKKDWKPDTTLAHVLAVVRCLLIVPFPESSLNDEAGKMFMESYEEYCRKARLVTSVHALKAAAGLAAGAGAAPAAAGAGGDSTSAASSSTSSSAAVSGSEGAVGSSSGAGDASVGASAASSSSSGAASSVAVASRAGSGADAITRGKVNVAGPAAAPGGAAEKRPRDAVPGSTSASAAAAAAAMGVKKKSMKRL
jgi:ubiquitin-conjugating enzyme E2 S